MSLLPRLHAHSFGARSLVKPLLSAAAGWLAYSRLAIDHSVALPKALAAEHTHLRSAAGKLGYYCDPSGSGRALVLIHGLHSAASAYDMRPLFNHFRGVRPVYALDLPGFGTSSRRLPGSKKFTPALYRNAIVRFLEATQNAPVDVIALSQSCEFTAMAAELRPQAVHSLALLSPTGLGKGSTYDHTNMPHTRSLRSALARRSPLLRQAFFDLITSRPGLLRSLGRSFVAEVDPDLAHYAFLTSHQPHAATAPLAILAGHLATPDLYQRVYLQLRRPTLAVYDRDPRTSFERLPELMAGNEHWRAIRVVPSRGLPHWDKLPETVAALEAFWASIP